VRICTASLLEEINFTSSYSSATHLRSRNFYLYSKSSKGPIVVNFPIQLDAIRTFFVQNALFGSLVPYHSCKVALGRFSPSSSVSPAIVVRSTNYSTIILMYHPGKMYNRPNMWPQYWGLYEPRGPAKGPNGG
jgi:hypothetical protein